MYKDRKIVLGKVLVDKFKFGTCRSVLLVSDKDLAGLNFLAHV